MHAAARPGSLPAVQQPCCFPLAIICLRADRVVGHEHPVRTVSVEVAEVGRPQLHVLALPPSAWNRRSEPLGRAPTTAPERPIDDQQT